MSLKPPIESSIVIVGPTAIGKTAVAVEMARERPNTFEIVSADSIQVYQQFDLGSAKPTVEERSVVPFHLVDVAAPDSGFTVVDFVSLATSALESIVSRGKIPLIVGGAGLYVRALIKGLGIPIAGPDPDLRRILSEEAALSGSPSLHAKLQTVDPITAGNLHPNDLKRIIRALEVFELSGRPLSEWHEEDRQRPSASPRLYVALDREREKLYEQIDGRVDSMFESGLMDEVRSLRLAGYGADLKPMTSVGYLQANMALDGVVSELDARTLAKNATHQYARRQLIWFRQEPVTSWIKMDDLSAQQAALVLLQKIERDREEEL